MIYTLIFLLGSIATICSLTGAVLIGRQEEQDFVDREDLVAAQAVLLPPPPSL